MSCGQIALKKNNINFDKYFASEIDKYAIKVTQKNHPDTIQLGDVITWREWDLPEIDLLIGGSPCQGFSLAGKGLNFDDPRSKLFFEYVDILKAVKPKYFLLENVRMKKEHEDVITDYLGVEPIEINSSLVSAQNRVRLYWTNIPDVGLPEDKGIILKDIFDYHPLTNWEKQFDFSGKHPSIEEYIKIDRKGNLKHNQSKASCLTGGHRGDGNHSDMDLIVHKDHSVRRYSPIECERLQTLPDNYTEGVSNTQRYKMLGNGWTVDVIAHILKNISQ